MTDTAYPKARSVFYLALGIALAPVLIGIPLLALGVCEILAWAHRVEATSSSAARVVASGWTAMLVLALAVVTGVVLGIASVDAIEAIAGDETTAIAIVSIGAPLCSGLLFAPLAFLPSIALVHSRPAWIVESAWLAAHLGAARTALLGVRLGAHGALPFVAGWTIGVADEEVGFLAFLAACVLTVLLAPFTLRAVARTMERTRDAVAVDAQPERLIARVRALVIMPLAVLAIAIAIAASAPLPLREVDISGTGAQCTLPCHIDEIDAELDARGRFLVVTGATTTERHPIGDYFWNGDVRWEPVPGALEPAYRVTLSHAYDGGWGRARELILDRRGHRLDDGPARRLAVRATPSALALLALACAIGVFLVVRASTARLRARVVAGIIEGGAAARGVDRVAGVVRGHASLSGGRLRSSGSAVIEAEGGAIRIALPDGDAEVLAAEPDLPADLDGVPVVLVAKGAKLGGVGPREASAPWPAGGALVVGDPVRARVALVRREAPAIARSGAALAVSLVIATIAILFGVP